MKAESVLSLDELHAIFSMLSGSTLMIASEEEFYIRIGFFKEQVAAFAGGLVRAVLAEGGPSPE